MRGILDESPEGPIVSGIPGDSSKNPQGLKLYRAIQALHRGIHRGNIACIKGHANLSFSGREALVHSGLSRPALDVCSSHFGRRQQRQLDMYATEGIVMQPTEIAAAIKHRL